MNGIRVWLWQRLSAIILAIYLMWLLWVLASGPNYAAWHSLFSTLSVKIATLLSLFALIVHSYIGIWTILTDYLKCPKTRICVLGVIILGLAYSWLFGVMLIWGVSV